MGNIHPPPASPRPSVTSSVNSSRCAQAATRAVGQLCPLSLFILGGPMPPSPGLIPLCWEDLVDWTNDAIEIAEQVYQRSKDHDILNNLSPATCAGRGVRFVPYVSVHETDAALQKLASQSYMERAQFYQESVVIAAKSVEDDKALCLISLFQFCRYFTLIRRLADSQLLVLEYRRPNDDPLQEDSPFDDLDDALCATDERDSLLAPLIPFEDSHQLQDCVICLEKTEDSVLHCCSQAICRDCERRWVRKRLQCPFCRQPFRNVREAITTQWQLSSAIPVEQVIQDMKSLEEKVDKFWEGLALDKRSDEERLRYAAILEENYVERPKTLGSSAVEEGDGFVLVDS